MIYTVTVLAHSWLRWLVLPLMMGRIAKALVDRSKDAPYEGPARGFTAATVGLMDVMLLLGVVLLGWLSPLTTAAMADMGSAMGDPLRRFWLVEHPTMMFLALVVAHVGSLMAKRATESRRSHTIVAVALTVALLMILAAIPWPFREAIGRPLFSM